MREIRQLPQPLLKNTSIDSSTQTAAEKRAPLEALQMAEHLTRMFHANKCPFEKGHCPASKFCAQAKVLWRHMRRCYDPKCKYDLCRQVKRALDHYRICRVKSSCPCCSHVDERLARRRLHQAEKRLDIYVNSSPASAIESNKQYKVYERMYADLM